MRLSEKQIMCLIDILKDSIKGTVEIAGQFSISAEQRRELYSVILNQQSDKLKVIEDDE